MSLSSRSLSAIHHPVLGPAIAGLMHFALVAAQIRLTQIAESQSIIWPANAVLLALMLQYPPRHWWRVLLAGVIGYIAASLLTRGFVWRQLLFMVANIAEVVIAAWGLSLRVSGGAFLSGPKQVWRFMLWAGLIAPLIGGGIGAIMAATLFDGPILASIAIWYIGDALGLLALTPFLHAMFNGDYHVEFRKKSRRQHLEALALLLITAAATTGVFFADQGLLFLISMPLMLVTFRQGLLGAGVAILVIAAVGIAITTLQAGPIARISPIASERVLFFQIFLAAMLLTSFPVAAAVAASRELTRKLRASERRLRLFTAQSPTVLLHFDREGICRKALGADDVIDGGDPATLIGASFQALSADAAERLRAAHASVLSAQDATVTVEFPAPSDPDRWLEAAFCAMLDETGRCSGTLVSIHNITQRWRHAAALARSAQTDSLTGALNRAGFMTRLDAALARDGNTALALAMIDIDRFKLINDNAGHPTGDVVLREVAQRIIREVRAEDAVGRVGGDEFIVLIDASNGVDPEDICGRIVAAVAAAPIALPSGGSLRAAISCGVVRRKPGQPAAALLEAADTALYEAKRGGRNRVVAA